MKVLAALLAGLLGFAVVMTPAASVAQQGGGANAAKAKACREEASQMVRRSAGKSGGSNVEAAKAQGRVYCASVISSAWRAEAAAGGRFGGQARNFLDRSPRLD